MTRISKLFFKCPARYLLLAAAILQLTLTLSLYTMGRLAVSPQRIDEHGLLISVLPDTETYQPQANDAAEILKHLGIRPWLLYHADAHVKFYSLSYLVFGPLVGNNIVGAEPFNLACYLAILILVAKLGTEVFDSRTGRVAAAVVALWPSFLVHNVQVLKDPILCYCHTGSDTGDGLGAHQETVPAHGIGQGPFGRSGDWFDLFHPSRFLGAG